MKKAIYIFFLIGFACHAQHVLQGKILDEQTKEPLELATIFVSNTTYKTATDKSGHFSITVPTGDYQLIVSFIGFEPKMVKSESFTDYNQRYTILLSQEMENLKTVTIMSKKMRENYLRIFKENLVGTSRNAEKTKITNLDDVLVNLDDDGNLEVSSEKPLEIENPELNYKLSFVLAYFKYDFKNALSHYAGYQSFEDLAPITDRNSKDITKNKHKAWHGSIAHFIKSVYNNTFEDQGFHVKFVTQTRNPKYPGDEVVKARIAEAKKTKNYSWLSHIPPKNIVEIGKRFLNRSDFILSDAGKFYFYIPDYLQIFYTGEKEESNFVKVSNKMNSDVQESQLKLENSRVELYPDGNFSNPEGLIFYGYMGWEKLADMLPFNYEPALDIKKDK